jgi:HD superfamily phosphodiesterase
MNLLKEIEAAEKKYRQKLENYFIGIWGETKLYSHDITHHRRVWLYAKMLMQEVYKENPESIGFSPDKMLITCYLHDLGMSVDKGERHGIHSSKFLRDFLSIEGVPEQNLSDAIEAVKYHDRKEPLTGGKDFKLATILSAADDLDAFGFIGVYRYLEIYLARGIHPLNVGYEIIKNARNRFANFELVFGDYIELIDEQRKRYQILHDFFKGYNQEVVLKD